MFKTLIPIVLALIGTGAGVGAGLYLMPPPAEEDIASAAEDHDCPPPEAVTADANPGSSTSSDPSTREYVRITNQFVIPIMGEERVAALVVASLSVEVAAGTSDAVYAREPKLRDVFLQILFDHANIGGFEGSFTAGQRMDILREALLDGARSVLGSNASDVLITEIARQDA